MSTVFDKVIDAGTDAVYEAQLTEITGANITKSSLIDLRVTITDLATAQVIRDNQNVLDANGGSVSETGLFVLNLEGSSDTAEKAGGRRQKRKMKFNAIFVGGKKVHVVTYFVRSVD
jgi:hypothetical protein